jgi:hypothetical protein
VSTLIQDAAAQPLLPEEKCRFSQISPLFLKKLPELTKFVFIIIHRRLLFLAFLKQSWRKPLISLRPTYLEDIEQVVKTHIEDFKAKASIAKPG